MKMRVLQILPRLDSGGVERGTVEVASALVDAGHKSFVCSEGGRMVQLLKGSVHISLAAATKNPIKGISNIFSILKILREFDIDVVHVRSRAPAWSAWIACKIARKPIITTFHGTYSAQNAIKKYYNAIMLRGDRVIAVSEFISEHIKEVYNPDMKNVIVLNRGVNLKIFNHAELTMQRLEEISRALNMGDEVCSLLMPARFARWKGHLYLLDILREMKYKNFHCYMVGEMPSQADGYIAQVQNKIKECGLEGFVSLHPHISDMPALYGLMDVVISSSLKPEAFGRTIVEAQAMGKVVIATAHGGAVCTISNKINGFHIPSNNARLAATIMDDVLTADVKCLDEVRENAIRNASENFSIDTMCKKTIELYQEVINSRLCKQ